MHSTKFIAWDIEAKELCPVNAIQFKANLVLLVRGDGKQYSVSKDTVILIPNTGMVGISMQDVYLLDIIRLHDGNHVVVRWDPAQGICYLQGKYTWPLYLVRHGTRVGNVHSEFQLWDDVSKGFNV